MSLARYVAALMEGLIPDDLTAMRPAERERFAQICRRWADLAEAHNRPVDGGQRGVLAELKQPCTD